MEENDIKSMMNQTPEQIKEVENNKSTENIYGEEPIYKVINFDAMNVVVNKPFPFVMYADQEIPSNIEDRMIDILQMLQKDKHVMRMGGDTRNTLEIAAAPLFMFKEIYLAWANSNKQLAPSATRKKPSDMAYRVAVWMFMNSRRDATEEKFNGLPFAIKALLSKDVHLLYGNSLDSKIGAIIIYTKCGTTKFGFNQDFKSLGRASNWITYANKFGVKIYNIGDEDSYTELKMTLAAKPSESPQVPVQTDVPAKTEEEKQAAIDSAAIAVDDVNTYQ